MLDQSHNVTDPIESLLVSAEAVAGAYVRALLVDREALRAAQEANDVMTARKCLKDAFECQVAPILGMVRAQLGGAINPLQVYRASAYRQARAADRPTSGGRSAGIV
jgi:L-rhamnose isomerase/sugar isomerase